MKDTMLSLYVKFQNAMKRNEGQGMVEYALIVGLIALVLVTALTNVEGGISGLFGRIKTQLDSIK